MLHKFKSLRYVLHCAESVPGLMQMDEGRLQPSRAPFPVQVTVTENVLLYSFTRLVVQVQLY